MEDLHQVDFTEALLCLQGLIDERVTASFNLFGRFSGFGVEGRLERVETLPPDHTAISIVLDQGQGFFLDPAEFDTFLACGHEDDGAWLEFRFGPSASLVLTRAVGNSP